LERLADLASREGRTEDVARLRRRKAELDQALHRYRAQFRAGAPLSDPARMAVLAETLGHKFEALGLGTLARERAPAAADARAALERLSGAEPSRSESGRTLSDVVAAEPTAEREAIPRRSPSTAARRLVPLFRDDAKTASLHFTFVNGATAQKQLPE